MATITVTFPDAMAPRVRDALCARWGYSASTGLTKAQFIQHTIAANLKREVVEYEASQAAKEAFDAARAATDAAIDLT